MLVALLCLPACSREQQDWRSAEAADTAEGYGQFLERHPESELATQARTRVAQLSEDREWQRAGSADTADAYRQFLAQHPNGKWAQEARIRIENFSLGGPEAGEASPVGSPRSGSAEPASTVGPPRSEDGPAVAPAATRLASATSQTTRTEQPSGAVPAASSAAQLTSAAPAPVMGYGVQLGAFSSEGAATHEWQQLTGRFGTELRGLSPHVVTANTATGHIFRLQAQVTDESRARAICDSLKKQSQPCVPVLPH
jgi:cell division septation protein DedD